MQREQIRAAKAVGCDGFLEGAASCETVLHFPQTFAIVNKTKVQWTDWVESAKRASSDVRARGAKFRQQSTRWSGSVAAAPAILPRDAEGLEVMLAIRVVAADAVELHGLITVHLQHERRAEANALLFNVAVDLMDRRASAFELTSVESQPAARREGVAEA